MSRTLADDTIVSGWTSWPSPSRIDPDEPDGPAEGAGERLGEPVADELPVHGPSEEVGRDGTVEGSTAPSTVEPSGNVQPEPLGRRVVLGHDLEESAEVGGVEQRAGLVDQVEAPVPGDPTRGQLRLAGVRKA